MLSEQFKSFCGVWADKPPRVLYCHAAFTKIVPKIITLLSSFVWEKRKKERRKCKRQTFCRRTFLQFAFLTGCKTRKTKTNKKAMTTNKKQKKNV